MTKLILVGGFLGAGKTTLLLESARWLSKQGYRVGLVTNDQGEQLVDTSLANDASIPVSEVSGGCFCCRFPDLLQAMHRLQEAVQPEVILAEPVGSCTDLAATVLRPLSLYYGEEYTLAPLTVLVGADHDTSQFSGLVNYLYEKQLAEAEYILLNKSDLLDEAARAQRLAQLSAAYGNAKALAISARNGSGVAPWLEQMLATESRLSQQLQIDYGSYAEAEAELGWLNSRGLLQAGAPFSPEEWMARTMLGLSSRFAQEQTAIAHMKMHLQTPQGVFKASMTATEGDLSWDSRIPDAKTEEAQFIFNLRAASSPQQLEEAVRVTLDNAGVGAQVRCEITHFECFRPSPPKPTYRIPIQLDASI
jgi:G3E family GTPase